jgi:LemA protein
MPGNNRRVPLLKGNARKSRSKRFWIVVSILVFSSLLLLGAKIYYYNLFVNLQQDIKSIQAQIGSSFQMRENLVPVLTSAVTNFVKHEDNVFMHTTDTRANSISPRPSEEGISKARTSLPTSRGTEELLSRLLAIAEQYPDLKSSEPFQLLMSKIADAETTIWEKRIEYNNTVNRYNSVITSFPGIVYGLLFGFRKEPYFEWAGKPEWVFELNANE